MKKLILICGAALVVASPAIAGPRHHKHRDHDRYESPYSNEAMARKRAAREEARQLAREIREQEREERAYRAYDADDDDGYDPTNRFDFDEDDPE